LRWTFTSYRRGGRRLFVFVDGREESRSRRRERDVGRVDWRERTLNCGRRRVCGSDFGRLRCRDLFAKAVEGEYTVKRWVERQFLEEEERKECKRESRDVPFRRRNT